MNVFLAGASTGIGYACLKEFLAKGCYVYSLGRRSVSGYKHHRHLCFDLSSPPQSFADIARWLQEQKVQKLDVLLYNAGYLVNKLFENQSESDIKEQIHVNFVAAIHLLQTLRPFLQQGSHVVNIASMGGYQGSQKFPGLSVYSASKAALASLSECLAQEWQTAGIAVNCLALGAVQTEMLTKAFPDYQAPLQAEQAAHFITDFCLQGHHFFNGKILPVSVSTP